MPDFATLLERVFQTVYTDIDGVAQGLNYSSTALDSTGDMKRDIVNITNDTYTYDVTGVGTADSPGPGTHYSVNDLVMAFVLNKCFGSSSFDAWDIVYNLQDAFGMLTNSDLADAIEASLVEEEVKATANVTPVSGSLIGKLPAAQSPGDDKGRVDEMFRSLLSMDPQRFYKNGTQIAGLFETNTDAAGSGNWCLGVGDKIEIPVRLYFRAPVTVLSVVDNAKNPSSATPDHVETVFIKGEGSTFDATDASEVAAADRGNVMSLRLQLVCSAPVMDYPATRSSSEDLVANPLLLQVVNKTSLVFYYGPHYPIQTAIAVVVAGGTAPYTYLIRGGLLPPGITIDSLTGIITFDPTDPNAVPGRWELIPVAINDTTSNAVQANINITVDGVAGSSAPPSSLTLGAPTSQQNTNPITSLGNNNYSISGYTQSTMNINNADRIDFNPQLITGTWVITAAVNSAGTSTTPTIPTTPNNNTVSYDPSFGELVLHSGDPLYPPGSTVVFTATCTRASDGAVGTTILNVPMPLTEIVPRLVMDQSDTSISLDPSQITSGIYTYNVGDNVSIQTASPGSQYITVVGVPAAAGYDIHVSVSSGLGQATWNSASSQIDITTNVNIGNQNTIGKGFTFTYEDSTGAKMPLGITSGNDELMVNVIDEYQ
jgi:hypothetical protein